MNTRLSTDDAWLTFLYNQLITETDRMIYETAMVQQLMWSTLVWLPLRPTVIGGLTKRIALLCFREVPPTSTTSRHFWAFTLHANKRTYTEHNTTFIFWHLSIPHQPQPNELLKLTRKCSIKYTKTDWHLTPHTAEISVN